MMAEENRNRLEKDEDEKRNATSWTSFVSFHFCVVIIIITFSTNDTPIIDQLKKDR